MNGQEQDGLFKDSETEVIDQERRFEFLFRLREKPRAIPPTPYGYGRDAKRFKDKQPSAG